eukprot:463656-Rhodomonas_salina.4
MRPSELTVMRCAPLILFPSLAAAPAQAHPMLCRDRDMGYASRRHHMLRQYRVSHSTRVGAYLDLPRERACQRDPNMRRM